MQQLTNGTLLQGGKYRIEEKIGQGGFGITYRACQPLMLGRKVCIKEFCLKQHFSRDSTTSAITYPNDTARKDAEMFQQKFIKEAQTLYSMRHPNIMEIYDIFEENNTAYYVMEYIEGESLKDMLERRGCIPEAEAIGYIHKVAEALKYIHSRNINHFDVKPANILVRSSDKEVILIDFGTAKHYDSNTGNATTMTSGLLSPGYAPIEQYQQGGVSAFTPETDIYALGATLYKLLTGNTPPEPTEIISNGLPELPLTVTKATTDLVKWAMQLNKANRPHTCDEFLDSLPSELPDVTIIVSEESDADWVVEDEILSVDSNIPAIHKNAPQNNSEEETIIKSEINISSSSNNQFNNHQDQINETPKEENSLPIDSDDEDYELPWYQEHRNLLIAIAAICLFLCYIFYSSSNTNTENSCESINEIVDTIPTENSKNVAIIGDEKINIVENEADRVYDVVDQMPSYPGGHDGLFSYLSSHAKYPAAAEKNRIQGRVTIKFVVEKDGSISNVKTMKSVHPTLDKEAERVINQMPKWNPGKQNGTPVRVNYYVPVVFRLQ